MLRLGILQVPNNSESYFRHIIMPNSKICVTAATPYIYVENRRFR